MTALRVVVTGAAGFIGRHIVEILRGEGCHVVGVGRHPSEMVEFVDDLRDVEALSRLLETEKIDSVVHCAWNGHPRSSPHDFSGQLQSNVLISANLGLASGLAGVRQIVFISSGGAAHRGTAAVPPPAYGWGKMAAEAVLSATAESFGAVLTVLRPSAVFGPGQNPEGQLGAVAVFADRLLRGLPLDVFGSLEQSRDFLHVRDLADAVLACLDKRVAGVFPVGGPSQITIGALIRTLEGACHRTADVRLVPSNGVDQVVVHLDGSALHAATGWKPRRDLESNVNEVVAYVSGLHQLSADSPRSDAIARG